MKKVLIAPGIVMTGLALMVMGVVTTYVALGQDVSPEATEEAVAPVPTFTPIAVIETGKATDRQSQSVDRQGRKNSGNYESETSNERRNRQGDGAQGQGKGANQQQESPEQVQDFATLPSAPQAQPDVSAASPDNGAQAGHSQGHDDASGSKQGQGAYQQQAQDSITTVPAPQAQPDVNATPPDNGINTGHGQGRDSAPGQNKTESGHENAAGEPAAAQNGSEHADHGDGVPPAAAGQSPDGRAAEVVPPEPPGSVPETVTPGAESPVSAAVAGITTEPESAVTPVETGVVPSLVSGRVDSRVRVSVTLTMPTGEVVSQAADEQGAFQFEVTEPGEYRLVASAPGALSRQAIFNLDAGQQVELPPTSLSPGDVNQDSRIDMSDIVLVAANYDGPAQVAQADLNGDSRIDLSDLTLVGAKFGLTGPLPWDAPSP